MHTLDDLLFTFCIQNVTVRLNVGAAPANSFVQAYPINALLVPAATQTQQITSRGRKAFVGVGR